jgi:succinate dehydrogenase / fumarate reductase, iron-sulfur subunit
MEMRFKIFRFDPELDREPRYQDYVVSARPEERILDCLNRIRWEQDGTLAYRMSCAHGVCGSDGMKINGRCALACQKLVKDYLQIPPSLPLLEEASSKPEEASSSPPLPKEAPHHPPLIKGGRGDLPGIQVQAEHESGEEAHIVLEPLPFFPVVKDLIVDMEDFLERIRDIRPYLLASTEPPEKERLQSPEEQKKVDAVIRCILCACCTSSCPVMFENGNYVGPAALVWAFRYIFESRDEQRPERLRQIDTPDGVWSCVNHFECTRACPKQIPITKSINTLKRELEKLR